jgi:hypothetical protein
MPTVLFEASSGQLDPSSVVSSAFGTSGMLYGSIRRIVSQRNGITRMEILPPPISSPQMLSVTLSIYPAQSLIATSVTFPVFFFDDKVVLQCGTVMCQGPSSGNNAFLASISNLNLVPDVAIGDQIVVLLGDAPAKIVSSSISAWTNLTILPPQLQNEGDVIGSQTVNLVVAWSSSASVVTSSQFTYWVPPRVSEARFSPLGESIIVLFDSRTNRGNQSSQSDSSCSSVVKDSSRLGIGSKCSWVTDSQLNIYLGSGATVTPGSSLQILNLRSYNGVSDTANPAVVVQPPEFPILPSLALKGPSTIDPCSALELNAITTSPRPLNFAWSCPNDEGLNTALSGISEGSVLFSAGTPSMQTLDKIYVINVQGTDFLGFRSAITRLSLLKKSFAVPQLTFSPATLRILRSQAAEVKGEAVFSACPMAKTKIVFTWRQIAGPTAIPKQHLGNLSQLSIPPNVLAAESTYVLALRVAMSDDPSKASEAEYSIQVGTQPLVARIVGGGGDVWAGSALLLDASESRDLDLDPSAPQGLSFAWTCSVPDASGLDGSCVTQDEKFLEMPGTPRVSLSPWTLAPSVVGAPYRFTVTVRKQGRLAASSSTTVFVQQAAVPQAGLSAEVSAGAYRSDGSIVINADGRLVLRGSCKAATPGAADPLFGWSFEPALDPWLLADTALFPLGMGSSSLVVAGSGAGGAQLPGLQYRISLTCTDALGSGSVGLVVGINFPPSGGTCGACRLGSASCAKTGRAVVDQFRMECGGWADENLPLEYRFGMQPLSDGAANAATWFAFSAEQRVDLLFPAGTYNALAIVRDALGAQSEVKEDPVVAIGGGRRADVGGSGGGGTPFGGVDDALPMLDDLLKQGAVGRVDLVVAALAMELDRVAAGWSATEGISRPAEQRRDTMLSALVQAAELTVLTTSYACEALGAARQVAASGNLSNMSVGLAAPYVLRLVGSSSVAAIDQACGTSAATVIGAAMRAATRLNATADSETIDGLLRQLEPAVLAVFGRASVGLLPGEAMPLSSDLSHVELRRLQVGSPTEYGICSSAADGGGACARYGLRMSLPPSLADDLSLPVGAVFDLILHAYDRPPGGVSAAPLVVVALARPGGAAVPVRNLTARIRLSLPADGPGGVVCSFWDPESRAYSQRGVETHGGAAPGRRNVTCLTSHLSAFTLLPGGLGPVPVLPTLPSSTPASAVVSAEAGTAWAAGTPAGRADPATTAVTPPESTPAGTLLTGLEALGPVEVLLPTLSLGVPSASSASAYSLPAPFDMVRIVVPAGAWPADRARREGGAGAGPQLTVVVFSLPGDMGGLPGRRCGPAVGLGPYGLRLAAPLSVSVPCAGTAPDQTVPAAYGLNPSFGNWTRAAAPLALPADSGAGTGTGGVVWAETATVGPIAAFWIPAPPGGGLSDQSVLIAAVVASAVCLAGAAIVATAVGRRRGRAVKAKAAKAAQQPSISGDAQVFAEPPTTVAQPPFGGADGGEPVAAMAGGAAEIEISGALVFGAEAGDVPVRPGANRLLSDDAGSAPDLFGGRAGSCAPPDRDAGAASGGGGLLARLESRGTAEVTSALVFGGRSASPPHVGPALGADFPVLQVRSQMVHGLQEEDPAGAPWPPAGGQGEASAGDGGWGAGEFSLVSPLLLTGASGTDAAAFAAAEAVVSPASARSPAGSEAAGGWGSSFGDCGLAISEPNALAAAAAAEGHSAWALPAADGGVGSGWPSAEQAAADAAAEAGPAAWEAGWVTCHMRVTIPLGHASPAAAFAGDEDDVRRPASLGQSQAGSGASSGRDSGLQGGVPSDLVWTAMGLEGELLSSALIGHDPASASAAEALAGAPEQQWHSGGAEEDRQQAQLPLPDIGERREDSPPPQPPSQATDTIPMRGAHLEVEVLDRASFPVSKPRQWLPVQTLWSSVSASPPAAVGSDAVGPPPGKPLSSLPRRIRAPVGGARPPPPAAAVPSVERLDVATFGPRPFARETTPALALGLWQPRSPTPAPDRGENPTGRSAAEGAAVGAAAGAAGAAAGAAGAARVSAAQTEGAIAQLVAGQASADEPPATAPGSGGDSGGGGGGGFTDQPSRPLLSRWRSLLDFHLPLVPLQYTGRAVAGPPSNPLPSQLHSAVASPSGSPLPGHSPPAARATTEPVLALSTPPLAGFAPARLPVLRARGNPRPPPPVA